MSRGGMFGWVPTVCVSVLFVAAASAAGVFAQEPPPPPSEVPASEPSLPERVSGCVARLGDPSFAVREDASSALLQEGGSIVPALREALAAATDLEVRTRLERIIETLDPPPAAPVPQQGGSQQRQRARLIPAEGGVRIFILEEGVPAAPPAVVPPAVPPPPAPDPVMPVPPAPVPMDRSAAVLERGLIRIDVRIEGNDGAIVGAPGLVVVPGEEATWTLGEGEGSLHLVYLVTDAPDGFVHVRLRCGGIESGEAWSFSSESYVRRGEPASFSVDEEGDGLRFVFTVTDQPPPPARGAGSRAAPRLLPVAE